MSTFESGGYQWIETYFVLFDSGQRPTADKVRKLLNELGERFEVVDLRGDDAGQFESVSVRAPDAYAAIDVSYLSGEEVIEQNIELTDQLKGQGATEEERRKIARIPACDGRFDVLHFEELVLDPEEEDGMLDPSALLEVLGALVKSTHGVAVDPQSGTIVL